MGKVIQRQLGQIINADTGEIQVYHYETDSDMVLISGKSTTLTCELERIDAHTHDGAGVILADPSMVVATDADGKLKTSEITLEELNTLDGITGNVQALINTKAAENHNHDTAYLKQILVGSNGGIVPLGENGKIAAKYLPSYVDDVIEGHISEDKTAFTPTDATEACIPESGKTYIDIDLNKTFRWSGTIYVALDEGVALGETEHTAYRGDRGAAAYRHSQDPHARVDATLVEASTTNGNVKINSAEVPVYRHPTSTVTPTTGTASLTRGSSVVVVSDVTTDDKGHLTGKTTKTLSVPTATVDIQSGATAPTNQVTGDLWFQTL